MHVRTHHLSSTSYLLHLIITHTFNKHFNTMSFLSRNLSVLTVWTVNTSLFNKQALLIFVDLLIIQHNLLDNRIYLHSLSWIAYDRIGKPRQAAAGVPPDQNPHNPPPWWCSFLNLNLHETTLRTPLCSEPFCYSLGVNGLLSDLGLRRVSDVIFDDYPGIAQLTLCLI